MTTHVVWDRFIRIFHIALATGFILNATVTEDVSLLHNAIGYVLIALIMARIIWGLIGPHHAGLHQLFKGKHAIEAQIDDMKHHRRRAYLGHSPLGGLMVINLLVAILAICASGILMNTQTPPNWAELLHEALVVWATCSIIVHVTAVLWESLRTRVNLAAAMISGRKRIPDCVDIME